MIDYIPYLDVVDSLKQKHSCAIITDDNLTRFAKPLAKQLDNALLITVPPGERSKSREMKGYIEDTMLTNNMGRDSCIIALGGGVITDLAGFVAATYCRGIDYVSIPTTLLAMVDAAIGGKTAINTPLGKNMIGAFYLPSRLVYDLSLLQTLPKEAMRSALAEILKYGLIADAKLFTSIETRKEAWDARDSNLLKELIALSVEHKMQIVEKDAKEIGLRRILNFGHTIGHAIEKVMDYEISHGTAVAIGMLAEARIANLLGHFDDSSYLRLKEAIALYGFPLHICCSAQNLVDAMRLDKKARNGAPRFTLIEAIGSVRPADGEYCESVEDKVLQIALEETVSGKL